MRLNVAEFTNRCNQRGWKRWNQRAAGIGISAAAMSRLSNGGVASADAVAAIVSSFGPESYLALFEVESS